MINRSEFVGLAAGAAAAAVLNPIPESDSSIAISRIRLDRGDTQLPAYLAQPANAGPDTPGVVIAMHIWGVDESMRDTARRFAKSGFAAIVPDLYGRANPPDGNSTSDYKVFAPFAQGLKADRVDGDLRAAAERLRELHPQGKVGVTGFCMGGAIALRQAVSNGDVFAADVAWYGKVADLDPKNIHIPIGGNYGGKDTGIPAEGVRAFADALTVPHDIVVYPEAGHAFFDHTRSSWVQSAAEDAWKRTIAFFTKYLRA